MSRDDAHEIYAVRYGHHERRSPDNFVGGDAHDILQPLDYFVWAIVGPSGTFIVDTGFDADMAKKRGRTLLKPIREGLQAIGIAPETVENVIVSHLHYDHTGNHDLFPRARYHLQDTEMAYATGPACATPTSSCRSRRRASSPWCARCSMAASFFTTESTKLRPA
jgi:glyoxylase-like metal-dependent hydrolase (beta-lactamase superfamily II)